MSLLFRTLAKRPFLPKRLFFSSRISFASQPADSDLGVEILDPEQDDEETLKGKVQKSYVFLEKNWALPVEFPLFPFSRFSVNLSEARAKVTIFFFSLLNPSTLSNL